MSTSYEFGLDRYIARVADGKYVVWDTLLLCAVGEPVDTLAQAEAAARHECRRANGDSDD